jgi:hypothetical protein
MTPWKSVCDPSLITGVQLLARIRRLDQGRNALPNRYQRPKATQTAAPADPRSLAPFPLREAGPGHTDSQ